MKEKDFNEIQDKADNLDEKTPINVYYEIFRKVRDGKINSIVADEIFRENVDTKGISEDIKSQVAKTFKLTEDAVLKWKGTESSEKREDIGNIGLSGAKVLYTGKEVTFYDFKI